jgi:Flp pilus assembly pilin Flp
MRKKHQAGSTLIEYVLLLCMSLLIIVAAGFITSSLNNSYSNVGSKVTKHTGRHLGNGNDNGNGGVGNNNGNGNAKH